MRTIRIFWSLSLLFLSFTSAVRAQGAVDSLAVAPADPQSVQQIGADSLAAVEQVWDAANTAYINSDYHESYAITPVTTLLLTPDTDTPFSMNDFPERFSKWLGSFNLVANNF